MLTRVVKINPRKPEPAKIAAAAKIIKAGGTVVFPTETVYGIGADATNSAAVKKIYDAKGRPSDNPMIVHVYSARELFNFSLNLSQKAIKLAQKFWPGPLTIVVKKAKTIPDEVTSGLDTVAIRMPSHPVARALLKASGVPIAAPSANTSGSPSATAADHAIDDLKGRTELILDGGQVAIGIESTVIDMTANTPVLLRPGKITVDQIEKIIGKIRIHSSVKGAAAKGSVKSPGMKYAHYSPKAKVILITGNGKEKKMSEMFKSYLVTGKNVAIVDSKGDAESLAKNLFRQFRELDRKHADIIIVLGVEEKGIGLAVMNRVRKAASQIIRT